MKKIIEYIKRYRPIIERFPQEYRRMSYVEVFGGGGSVLYNKERSVKETINDVNSDLINLYRCIRERPDELIDKLTFVLNSREDFKRAQERLAKNEYADDIDKAADFYQTFRLSYGGKGSSFGANYRGMWSAFPIILEACARLQGVVIENGDFERILRKYDSPDTFFISTRRIISPRITTPARSSCGRIMSGWPRPY